MIIAVDWLLDSFATTINVLGDIIGAGNYTGNFISRFMYKRDSFNH